MPTKKSSSKTGRKKPGPRKASTKPRKKVSPPVGGLDQKTLDLIGLGLLALAAYFSFVLYFGWDGGRLGSALSDGLFGVFGLVSFLVPPFLVAAAVLLMFDPDLPSSRPVRAGSVVLVAGLMLLLAAGTMGIGGERPSGIEFFDPAWFPDHGGAVGEALYWGVASLLQPIGAHVLAVLAIGAGLLMITGVTVASIFRSARSGFGRVSENYLSATGALADRAAEVLGDRTVEVRPAIETELEEIEAGEETLNVDVWAEDEAEPDLDETEILAEEPPTLEDELPDPEEPDEVPASDEDTKSVQPELPLTPMGERRGATVASGAGYRVPARKLLAKGKKEAGPAPGEQKELARKLVETLGHFGVEAKVVGVVTGPHVSRFELQLAPGTKVKKVTELSNDLAYALASTDIRILAPIPGKQAVGVELPNSSRKMVRLGEIYSRPPESASPLLAWLGKGIDGKPVSADLSKMPHVLVAGTTGSGKSGSVNAILSSILMHSSPNEVRLVLVDPKQVELNHYENVPHLLTPVVTNPKLAANVLSNLIAEMESRYGVMKQARARNIADYNAIQEAAGEPTLPHILCVIDELADLMMVAPADVESSIIRLAQKSRATGIHLLLATQRPSTDIITGTIKVNIPSRIAFAVSSQTDSRVILDQGGAEALLGQGDMLYRGPGTSKLQRIQGAFVSEEEIARITTHWATQGEPEFQDDLLEEREPTKDEAGGDSDFDPDQDELLDQAIQLVVETETASVSMVQRRLRVGYTRAGRLIDMLERRGVISGYEGSKPRQVLITAAEMHSYLSASRDADEQGEPVGVATRATPGEQPDAFEAAEPEDSPPA
jgi:S-DNA-T family DNA segregation ATPase FtsK/SpoIIIE